MDTQRNSTTTSRDDWDQHWDRFAEAAEIGPTPRYRSGLITGLLDFSPPGTSIRFLEIGSGMGDFAEGFCKSYSQARYLGIELSQKAVATSRERVPKAQFLQRDLLESVSPDQTIEYGATHAICSEVLEHLEEPSVLLRNAGAYCQIGCLLIVTVPGGPMNAFYEHIGHRRHYSPKQLSALLENSGFKVHSSFGAGFPFFNLFRLLLTLRGSKVVSDSSGPPSTAIKIGSFVFDFLFRLNSRHFGWQTIAVARYVGQADHDIVPQMTKPSEAMGNSS